MVHDIVNSPALMWFLGAIFFGLILRGEIKGLLARVTKIGKTGIEALPSVQVPPQTGHSPGLSKFDDIDSISSDVLGVYLDAFDAEMRKRDISGPDERLVFLKKIAAGSVARLAFEKIYGAIFGSQIFALEFAVSTPAGTSESDLRKFFETGKKQDPQLYVERPFEMWLGFLVSANLLVRDGLLYKVTTSGKEFLRYLVEASYTKIKPG